MSTDNLDLINELIEAKADNSLADVLQEKIAALGIETIDDFTTFCNLVEEKADEMEKEAAGPMARGMKGALRSAARKETLPHVTNMRNMIGAAALGVIPSVIVGGYLLKHVQKKQSLEQVLKDKPDLKSNLKRTTEHFNMLFHIAPNLMTNHIIAGSILEQLSQYDMIDHTMLAKLIEADKNMNDSRLKSVGNTAIKSIGDTAGATNKILDMMNV
jgi:hypothetical protein